MPARTRSHSSGPATRGPAKPKRGGGKVPPFPPTIPTTVVPPVPPVPPTTGPTGGKGKGTPSTASAVGDDLEKSATRIIRYLKTTIKLNENNYAEYIVRLTHTAWSAGWHPGLLDLEQLNPIPWDGDETKDTNQAKQHRREAFDVVSTQIDESLSTITLLVNSGDVKQLCQRIHNRFCNKSSGVVATLRHELSGMTMQSTGLTLERYVGACVVKQKALLAASRLTWSSSSEGDLCSTIIRGLLPEFKLIQFALGYENHGSQSFTKIFDKLTEFAVAEGILHLKRGRPATNLQIDFKPQKFV